MFPGQKDLTRDQYRAFYDEIKHGFPDINTVCFDMAVGTGAEGKQCVYTRWVEHMQMIAASAPGELLLRLPGGTCLR